MIVKPYINDEQRKALEQHVLAQSLQPYPLPRAVYTSHGLRFGSHYYMTFEGGLEGRFDLERPNSLNLSKEFLDDIKGIIEQWYVEVTYAVYNKHILFGTERSRL